MSSCPQSLSPTMSITNQSKKAIHRRNYSGELDVFEAARYFSGGIDGVEDIREERVAWREEEKSLEIHTESILPPQSQRVEKHIKGKKCKQPNSPGGRLASFLNSLFHQTASTKKKSKSLKDEEEESLGGRKRRSSISHSHNISSESKSIYSCGSSGIRTPAPYTNTTTKVSKALGSYLNVKCNGEKKSVSLCPQSEAWDDKRIMDESWLVEKAKLNDGFLEKNRVSDTKCFEKGVMVYGNGFVGKDMVCSDGFVENKWVLNKTSDGYLEERIWVNDFTSKGNSFRIEEVEDGGESDSSSDLFELKNYDLGDLSSDLPVYESTNMEFIKRGSSIANVAF